MTKEEYENCMMAIARLCACVVWDEVPDPAWCAGLNLENLYLAAKKHLLLAITAEALERAGVHDDAFHKAKASAVRKSILFDAERAKILSALEEQGIWYMPLKGAVLKEFYPGIGLRQMADNDILYDVSRCEDVKSIMEGMGFQTIKYGEGAVHDSYHKKPVFNFEMHRQLFGPEHGDSLYSYYRAVKERLVKDEGNLCGWHFSPEDFYLYMISHESKHYANHGTGLRSLLDIYVYLRKVSLNWEYVEEEAKELGLAEFEKQNRMLAMHLFDGEALTEEESKMLDYVYSSGTYGTLENGVKNGIQKNGGSAVRYALKRFFVPVSKKNPRYSAYARAYPQFYKYKILLPLLPLYRVIHSVRRGVFYAEAKAIYRTRSGKT